MNLSRTERAGIVRKPDQARRKILEGESVAVAS